MFFDNINFDRWIGISGILLGLFALYLTYHLYKKGAQAKSLCIAPVGPISLIKRLKDTFINLDIFYDGAPVNGVYRTYILFWDFGLQFIDKIDFAQSIIIPDPEKKILLVEVARQDVASKVNLKRSDQNDWIVDIDLRRQGEAFMLTVDASDRKFRASVDAVSKSSNLVRRFPEARQFIIRAITFLFVISGFLIGFVLALMLLDVIAPYLDGRGLLSTRNIAPFVFIFCIIATSASLGVSAHNFLKAILGFGKSESLEKFIELREPRVFDDHLYETEASDATRTT